VVDGAVTDALKSDIITRLRAQYLDLATKDAELASKYGRQHQATLNVSNQMGQIRRAIQAELTRIAQSSRSEYEIALSRENDVQRKLDELVKKAGQSGQAQVELRDLESSAQTYRNLYDTFFEKFEEAIQQQSFPISDARLVTQPFPPDRPSWPKAIIIIPASIFLGLVSGFLAALVREFLGNNFRVTDDVVNYAGFECLGILPNLSYEVTKKRKNISDAGLLGGSDAYVRHAVNAPFSRFTETLRNVKVSIDIARAQEKSGVIGVVSSVPKEGKTTFSANLALLMAQMGHKTLLIDGDLHNPSLTRTLTPNAAQGMFEVLVKRENPAKVLQIDSETGLDFIPAVLSERHSNVVALLTSEAMGELLAWARGNYEYVVVDLPPIVPVVDVKAAAHMIDQFVFVIEWGVTTRDVVRDALEGADQLRRRVVGGVLNKADPNELKRFEAYKGRYYGNYYVEN